MVIDFQQPIKFRECKKFDTINLKSQEKYDKLNRWLTEGTGNLIFAGKTGRRKTFAACLCMNELKRKHRLISYELGFCNVSDVSFFFKNYQNTEERWRNIELFNRIVEYKVLVLDDLGVVDPTPSFLEFIYGIINKRCDDEKLATIYTTNLSAEELVKQFTARIASRIMDKLCIKLEGPDERTNLDF